MNKVTLEWVATILVVGCAIASACSLAKGLTSANTMNDYQTDGAFTIGAGIFAIAAVWGLQLLHAMKKDSFKSEPLFPAKGGSL